MHILGIETSCDETAAGVVKDGSIVLSNVVLSQEIHSFYGGVVPELASRIHTTEIIRVIDKALSDAGLDLNKIDGISVTAGPGLVGCLLVGISFAKSVSMAKNIPLYGANHLEGHIFAGKLENQGLSVPHIALVASGGHSNIYLVRDWGDYKLLGSTRDDAPGEAFDKVAKMLNLGYPGGPAIEKTSEGGNHDFIDFPRGMRQKGNFDFSFSGLKTAVLLYLKDKEPDFIEKNMPHITASFQEAVVEILALKTIAAAREYGIDQITVGGGVARNKRLREIFNEIGKNEFHITFPSAILCSDNGAMIAACGDYHISKGELADDRLNAVPSMEL